MCERGESEELTRIHRQASQYGRSGCDKATSISSTSTSSKTKIHKLKKSVG